MALMKQTARNLKRFARYLDQSIDQTRLLRARTQSEWAALVAAENEARKRYEAEAWAMACDAESEFDEEAMLAEAEGSASVQALDDEDEQNQAEALTAHQERDAALERHQRHLFLQRRAIYQLREAPLPHQLGLLRFFELPDKAIWPEVHPAPVEKWFSPFKLTDDQKSFVQKALATADFAFLDGPPGSGKTAALCELIHQLVSLGQRILFCCANSTGLDQTLAHLAQQKAPVSILRLDRPDDEDGIRNRIQTLSNLWWSLPAMSHYSDREIDSMAERMVVETANLTCATFQHPDSTLGAHPVFKDRSDNRPLTSMPRFDVLIVDDAQSMRFLEFLPPAMTAKRWILAGDLQSAPLIDHRALVDSLSHLATPPSKDSMGGAPLFPAEHQRACLVIDRLLQTKARQPGMRWLVIEPMRVLDWIVKEMSAEPYADLAIARVSGYGGTPKGNKLTLAQLRCGNRSVLRLLTADWILIDRTMLIDAADLLPANLLLTGPLPLEDSHPMVMRQKWWLAQQDPSFHETELEMQSWLQSHNWAQEIARLLTKRRTLNRWQPDWPQSSRDSSPHSAAQKKKQLAQQLETIEQEIDALCPFAIDLSAPLADIEALALPNVLDLLLQGVDNDGESALTQGLMNSQIDIFTERFELLSQQHRSHPTLSGLARKLFFGDHTSRDAKIELPQWNTHLFPNRCMWIECPLDQIQEEIRALLRAMQAWMEAAPKNNTLPQISAVCICNDLNKFFEFPEFAAQIAFQYSSLEAFQGCEADLILIALEPDALTAERLSAALTRARQQVVFLGPNTPERQATMQALQAFPLRSAIPHYPANPQRDQP